MSIKTGKRTFKSVDDMMNWLDDWNGDTLWEHIQFKYYKIVPYNYRPSSIWYYLKCLVWNKFNIIKCKSLPPTWVDRDKLLVHTMAQILFDFVEKERPQEWFNTAHAAWYNTPYKTPYEVTHEYDLKQIEKWRELFTLYRWFKKYINVYLKKDLYKIFAKHHETQQYFIIDKIEQCMDAKLEKQLYKLISLRYMLWT